MLFIAFSDAINPVIRLAMLVRDGNHDYPLYPDDVKHLVRKTIKYKTSYWLDFDLPSERAFLNELGRFILLG